MEYLALELIDAAFEKAKDNKKARIIPRHIMLAVRDDAELNKLLGNADFCQSGVPVRVDPVLVQGHAKKGKKGCCNADEPAEGQQDQDA